MHPLNEHLQNPLTRKGDVRDRALILRAFPALGSAQDIHWLAIRSYLNGTPERFFDQTACDCYFEWLQTHDAAGRPALRNYFSESTSEIDRALNILAEVNLEAWHDDLLVNDDYDLARYVDARVHPAYLRLVEAVLVPLSRPLAHFSRLERGKRTDGLDIWNIFEELSGSAAERLFAPYRHIIRNGLAHGGVTYLADTIRYRDKKGDEESFLARSVVGLCDDLVDICNGMALALKMFFSIARNRGYIPPRAFLVQELLHETRTPWWKIEAAMESELPGGPQLVIYARANTRYYEKVLWSVVQSGILTEYFAPGYIRYFYQIRSQKAWPGWAAFDGEKLRKLREGEVRDLAQYAGTLENGILFYVPKWRMPAFLGKLDTIVTSFRLNWPLAIQEASEQWGTPRITCRNATTHRNSWGAVLKGQVVVDGCHEQDIAAVVRKWRRRILGQAMHHVRRENGIFGATLLPVAYACVSVFEKDYRRRRLSSFGLGKELICTIRFQRLRRIQEPDILGSTIETIGNWRIAWNSAWLRHGQHFTGPGTPTNSPD